MRAEKDVALAPVASTSASIPTGEANKSRYVKKSVVRKLHDQIHLLIWKRWRETVKTKGDVAKLILPALLFFSLLLLVYSVFDFFEPDGIEAYFVPLGFWIYIQRLVVQIMYEKSTRLQESMRMMGLSDLAYWLSYFIFDGVIAGFVISFLCSILSTGGLFNDADFGQVLGLLFVFCLSAVPFGFFICSFFDTPQTSGQATLGLLLGFYVLYVVVFTADQSTISLRSAQTICSLFPPLALQIGSGLFLNSVLNNSQYDGLYVSDVCGIMVADIFIYSVLAWYFSQVWPSKVGVAKPWTFIFDINYWMPKNHNSVIGGDLETVNALDQSLNTEVERPRENIPEEKVNENILGRPTVVVSKLRKSFGEQVAVNDLSFKMYENQIFALLGHNGAGKTTTISMLVGLSPPDLSSYDRGATIYGSSIATEMDSVRYSLGVCPQHDVLFENLTVREHILFFAQLKGKTYAEANEEAIYYTNLFHLDSRLDHTGGELSGGQKRKLSVAIAVCGGSKFVVLDEPTAGMDPLARRELWDLLASLRKGRTMLLTTHYMDEADILGDRVGIMSLGQMQCVGSTQFLKTTYGAGYKLVFDKSGLVNPEKLAEITSYVQSFIPTAKYIEEDGSENQILYSLPFDTVSKFGPFFTDLEENFKKFNLSNFGVNITTLEDVFLKVGEDHTVTPGEVTGYGIGADRVYKSNLYSQIIGVAYRKLSYAMNDFITIPLILLPVAAGAAACGLYASQVIASDDELNDSVVAGMYLAAYLGAPGLIAEFIVRERNDKLRNVLTVMGCDFKAYWIGSFIADFLLLSIPMVIIWITWFAGGMSNYYSGNGGAAFFIYILFNIQMIAFSYFFCNIFSTPKSTISFMPILIILLLIMPNIIILIGIQIANAFSTSISSSVIGGVLLWGIMILSPHGAFFSALLDATQDYSNIISNFPPIGAIIAFMIVESVLYFGITYYNDIQSIEKLEKMTDPNFRESVLNNLDSDVAEERKRTLSQDPKILEAPLRIERLRKVFPPKAAGKKSVVATEDVCFTVESGEIFGLLGANGAGKTTTMSMLTRHLVPTSGDAFITKHSILSEFSLGATHLGVVTQNNSLWDLLSVEDHLMLFARLRGVPEDLVKSVVDGTIDQLELTPHRKKLSMRLSGGMKRKLCVAIALIGDPEVVLLDEPSAGLDPVSRRNLWSVILRTMSHRAVILTTHSMEEAEALCKRIGIMVHGQLRALGTKQHLKNKFGSGFELVVKVSNVDNIEAQTNQLLDFVRSMFPSALMISENGGLFTFQIPKEEMKMGKAFTELERNKEELHIEDYSVAQPTLEQVFIRTVNKHSEKTDTTMGSATVVGGSARMSVEGMGVLDDEGSAAPEEVFVEVNKCGCTNFFVKVFIGVMIALTILFLGINVAVADDQSASGAMFSLAIVFFISSIVGCNILCCACCQQPKGADD